MKQDVLNVSNTSTHTVMTYPPFLAALLKSSSAQSRHIQWPQLGCTALLSRPLQEGQVYLSNFALPSPSMTMSTRTHRTSDMILNGWKLLFQFKLCIKQEFLYSGDRNYHKGIYLVISPRFFPRRIPFCHNAQWRS